MAAEPKPSNPDDGQSAPASTRRQLLSRVCGAATAAGLMVGTGLWLSVGIRFAAAGSGRPSRLFVTRAADLRPGQTLAYELPDGEPLVIARQGSSGGVEDFVALSRRCPHMGCRVRFRPGDQRFVCPCHAGQFDVTGRPLAGPPLSDGESLVRFPLVEQDGLLFVRTVSFGAVSVRRGANASGWPRGREIR